MPPLPESPLLQVFPPPPPPPSSSPRPSSIPLRSLASRSQPTLDLESGNLQPISEDHIKEKTTTPIEESSSHPAEASAHAHFPTGPDDLESGETPMRKKTRAQKSVAEDHSARSSVDSQQNGHASGSMNYAIENRRKASHLDGNSEAQREHLMRSSSFTLDHEPPPTPQGAPSSTGFWDMPLQDRKNFLMLILLYFLQGIPMGLAGGSVPFLLKSHLSYGQIGVFSLALYPYSLKLLWSPIVDAVWSPRVGRRKSWILPIQALSGVGMIWLGGRAEAMMESAGAGGGAGIWAFTWWWFFLVFTCATQDIAVDGWAITLLSHRNLSYASTAQSVGLTGGQFMSYTVFLAFNSKDFTNKWFRTTDQDYGLMTLGGYLIFWGWIYIIVTFGLAFFKKEEKTKERDGIIEVYKVMGGILKLRNIQILMIIHLIAKLGFQANDAATNLKLIDKGFSQEDLALTVLIDFPFELSLGYYAGKWCTTFTPMRLWCWAFVGRLFAAVFAQFVVMIFPAGGTTSWYLLVVIVEHIFSTFMNTIMFVAVSAFHARIADPVIGGTYMTMLATVSNLGGTFPRFFILKLIDFFTVATCIPPSSPPPLESLKGHQAVTTAFSCVMAEAKDKCLNGGGQCKISIDGYYIMNFICIIVGTVTFFGFIQKKSLMLQALPLRAWRISGAAA